MLVAGSTATAMMAEGNVPATVQTNSSATEHHERRRYLVKITGCNGCHTPGYAETGGKVPEKEWLAGDSMGWRGPLGATYASNLRLHMPLSLRRPMGQARAHGPVSSAHAVVCPPRHDRTGSAYHLSVHQAFGASWQTGACLHSVNEKTAETLYLVPSGSKGIIGFSSAKRHNSLTEIPPAKQGSYFIPLESCHSK